MNHEVKIGPWSVSFDMEDGARISRLVYDGTGLLTQKASGFCPPKVNYGKYETRPVYGYDDCFPTVDSCIYPDSGWEIPDHGELCWLPWQVQKEDERLIFSVNSNHVPIQFIREMQFSEGDLIWTFKVINSGGEAVPFQHVMHPLLPLEYGGIIVHIPMKIICVEQSAPLNLFRG